MHIEPGYVASAKILAANLAAAALLGSQSVHLLKAPPLVVRSLIAGGLFMLFMQAGGQTIKTVCRYQQYRAVNRAQDGTLAGSWINFMESGRDWSFSKDMEVAIEKLTVKDVNAAIRRIADPSKMTFVLAADLAKAREAGKDFSKQ